MRQWSQIKHYADGRASVAFSRPRHKSMGSSNKLNSASFAFDGKWRNLVQQIDKRLQNPSLSI